MIFDYIIYNLIFLHILTTRFIAENISAIKRVVKIFSFQHISLNVLGAKRTKGKHAFLRAFEQKRSFF